VLELWEPEGALERLERWLADERAPGECADVYLGYRLGEPFRRAPWPAPAEPVALPVVAAQARRDLVRTTYVRRTYEVQGARRRPESGRGDGQSQTLCRPT